jgi:D-amino peptidase
MKILISVDMEGITGVTSWRQVDPDHTEYQRFRKLMTADTNAAIKGAFEGGADEVVIADAHWNGENILIEEIDSRARLNSGLGTAPLSMMQGIDENVDGVLFVGYHARAGSQIGVLDHTWSTKITNVWLNDILVGEFGLNAAVASHFGAPILMVAGDQIACEQCAELINGIESAVVKIATGRFSAECFAPSLTSEMIRNTARKAVARLKKGDAPELFALDPPITVTIEFAAADYAQRASRYPGAHQDGTRVHASAGDMPSAFTAFRVMAALAGE